jgi:hypothetical protein
MVVLVMVLQVRVVVAHHHEHVVGVDLLVEAVGFCFLFVEQVQVAAVRYCIVARVHEEPVALHDDDLVVAVAIVVAFEVFAIVALLLVGC